MTQSQSSPPTTAADTADATADETTRAPLPAEGTVLAWSDDAAPDVEPERAPWGVAWRRAAVVLAVCLMAAALVVLGWRDWSARHRGAPSLTTESAPATSASPPSPAASTAASPSPAAPAPALPPSGSVAAKMTPPPPALAADPDTIYLQLLSDAGVTAPTKDKAIANGRLICQQLGQGNSVQAVVTEVDRVNPSLGPDRSRGTVYAAIDAYCPHYEDRGER